MNRLNILLSVMVVLTIGCHRRAEKTSVEPTLQPAPTAVAAEEDMALDEGITQNRIIGRVVSRSIDPNRFQGDHPCNTYPCEAVVEIAAITQLCMNYHGQIDEGNEINVHFAYTLEPSASIFPELFSPLSGLQEGDYFEALLFDDEPDANGKPRFLIQLYERKQ